MANAHPRLRNVFDRWKDTDSDALLSNLSKNQELKSALLEETPWVRAAQSEEAQKRNIGLLFDLNRMSNEMNQTWRMLEQRQMGNGGFPWFPGGRDSWYITQYLLEDLGHLRQLGIEEFSDDALITKAVQYIDARLLEQYEIKKDDKGNNLGYAYVQFEKPEEAESERFFDLEIDKPEKGIRYAVRGYIDKLFKYKDNSVIIRDFKSSKQIFKGKELTDNLQDLLYTLAVKKLFPHFKKRQVEFLFLKFDLNSNGRVKMKDISEEELEGLEFHLTEIQKFIDNFDEETAESNFAGAQGYPSDGTFGGPLMCGKDGYKISKGQPVLDKSGQPIVAYICSIGKPLDYYVLKDENGKIIKSAFKENKESLKAEEGQTIEMIEYKGCPYWNKPKVDIDDFF